ncbi:MAG TPA: hypothetical protein VN238_15605 [Solirubrobacteraceae bacterium]|nr:hypothetical protein [Solirubrobacteraceae bacterium]
METYSDGREEFVMFTAAVRTTKPLERSGRRSLLGSIAVQGEVAPEASGRVGRRGRHCYSSPPIAPPDDFGSVRAGRIVEVTLTLTDGRVLRARVPVRRVAAVRSPFWRELGCGGKKT